MKNYLSILGFVRRSGGVGSGGRQFSSSSSSTPNDFDVIFIGGGPGGYVGAIKAAQLGLKTGCIEKRAELGGTCLNVGCIPSKSLLQNSHFYKEAKTSFAMRGIKGGEQLELDLGQMMKAKDDSVKALTGGIGMLFKKNGVHHIHGEASLEGPGEIVINGGSGAVIRSKNIVLATGSEVIPLPSFPALDGADRTLISSEGALSLQSVPKKMIVIGAGIIGLELGSVWKRLGAEVVVVEASNTVGGNTMDVEMATMFTKILKKQGLQFRFGAMVEGIERASGSAGDNAGWKVSLKEKGGSSTNSTTLSADVVLVCVGRRAYVDKLNLSSAGLKLDSTGKIPVNEIGLTAQPGIWAIGDLVKGPMLAHKAEEEGIRVAEAIANPAASAAANHSPIPSVIYTHPEVAWVGQTEEEAKAASGEVEYDVGTFPMMANSRARTVNDYEGQVKVIVARSDRRILGIHIIGPNAGELIGEATLAIKYGASAEDVARTCHAHPTFSEALKEACWKASSVGKSINF